MKSFITFIQNAVVTVAYLWLCFYSIAVMVHMIEYGKTWGSILGLIFVDIFWVLSLLRIGIFIYAILKTKSK